MAEGRRWLRQAKDDLAAADSVASESDLAPRIACFLAHLAAEKALKAVLIAEGRPLRKTHDLLDLARRLPTPTPRLSADDLDLLNVWVMEGRYPVDADEATRAEAIDCCAAAARLVQQVGAWFEAAR